MAKRSLRLVFAMSLIVSLTGFVAPTAAAQARSDVQSAPPVVVSLNCRILGKLCKSSGRAA